LYFRNGGVERPHSNAKRRNSIHDLGNVNVLALDMYDGKVATEREKMPAKYMGEFKADRGTAIFKGALDYAG
jgi:carboxymethylenebutenolidase